jgi:hypothetical protein
MQEVANAGANKQAAAFQCSRLANGHAANLSLIDEVVEMRAGQPEQCAGGAMICEFWQCVDCRRLWGEGCNLHFEDQHYSPTFEGVEIAPDWSASVPAIKTLPGLRA